MKNGGGRIIPIPSTVAPPRPRAWAGDAGRRPGPADRGPNTTRDPGTVPRTTEERWAGSSAPRLPRRPIPTQGLGRRGPEGPRRRPPRLVIDPSRRPAS